MIIQEITTASDFDLAFPLMKELRPHLDFENFELLITQARLQNKYCLIGLFKHDHYIALMGYRILFDLVHGKHLYIDDLVVSHKFRSQGLGLQLLQYAEKEAQKEQCKVMRLCTGIDNMRAMSFYEKNQWNQRAVVYKKKVEVIL